MSAWPDGLRVLHLQCRSGTRSLELARAGALVIGMDVAGSSVRQARASAAELGVAARFIEADLYHARHSLPEPESFDVVYTELADVSHLPDLDEWARIVAWFLKPGGALWSGHGYPLDVAAAAALTAAGLLITQYPPDGGAVRIATAP